jgi:hypothetical protein
MTKSMLVQSPEGQECVRGIHFQAMQGLQMYPTISRYVHNKKWADGFLGQMLAHHGTVEELAYPDLYASVLFAIQGIPSSFPEDYLERTETGLRFLLSHAKGQNKWDLMGRLRDTNKRSQTCSSVFEIMLAWALVSEFGESQVRPYPPVGDGSLRTMDFSVDSGGLTILIEATCLVKDSLSASGLGGIPVGAHAGADRIVAAIRSKASQRSTRSPFIVCLNQLTGLPFLRDALASVDKAINLEPDSNLVAVGYFDHDYFRKFTFSATKLARFGLSDEQMCSIERAFARLRS